LSCLVLGVGHMNKAPLAGERPTLGQLAGSFALAAMAATAITVWRPDEARPTRLRVACARAPETPFAPFDIDFTDLPGDALGVTIADGAAATRDAAAEQREHRAVAADKILAHLKLRGAMPQAPRTIADEIGTKPAIVAPLLGALERAGFVHCAPNPRGQHGLWTRIDGAPDHVVVDDAGAIRAAAGVVGVGGFVRARS